MCEGGWNGDGSCGAIELQDYNYGFDGCLCVKSWIRPRPSVQGMVDVGEVVSITIRREFGEEALNSLAASDDERKQIEDGVSELFAQGVEVSRFLPNTSRCSSHPSVALLCGLLLVYGRVCHHHT